MRTKKEVKIGDTVWDKERKGIVQKVDLENKRVLVNWNTEGAIFRSWKNIEGLDYRTFIVI